MAARSFLSITVSSKTLLPSSISFATDDITIVNDALRIETVIAPTKPCKIKMKGVYSIDGKLSETEVFDAIIDVPFYQEGAFGYEGDLTEEIAHDSDESKAHMMQKAEKYIYNPNYINPKKNQ